MDQPTKGVNTTFDVGYADDVVERLDEALNEAPELRRLPPSRSPRGVFPLSDASRSLA